MNRHRAILLTGPTGSGKSPLGDLMQARGACGRRCRHFDFGARLRAVAEGPDSRDFSERDIDFVRQVLAGGALLENDAFPLALRILDRFVERQRIEPGDWLVMNGLPRHLGQAQALDPYLRVQAVVALECVAPVVLERIALDSGGDRLGRTDDALALVGRKLEIFEDRTRPLVDLYRERGVLLIPLEVRARTSAADMLGSIEKVMEASCFADHHEA